ncbi:MAG: DNA polymerase III subunit delta [Pseudomonadota bacterium]
MKLKPEDIDGHLKRGLAGVYLVTGDEPLIVNEVLDRIRAAARADGFTTRNVHVAERGFDWNVLTQASVSMSLFSDRSIIDLRLPTGKPGDAGSKAIAGMLEHPPEDTLLLVSAPKLDGSAMSTRWVKAIDKAGVIVRVWPLEAQHLPRWINERMQQAGLTVSRDAVLHLARRVEGNLLAAQQEIDKLALLSEGRELGVDDIDAAVADSTRFTVFKLADEALAGRCERALRMLGGLRREGLFPVLPAWALTKETRQLTAMSEAMASGRSISDVLSQWRVWSNRQNLYRGALQRLPLSVLVQLVALCERIDRAAKGQSREQPWQLLRHLTAALASSQIMADSV